MSRFTKKDIIKMVEEEDVEFIRLQFTDLFGSMKNLAITSSHLPHALDNKVMFDGSSIEGFVFQPGLRNFCTFPLETSARQGGAAGLRCAPSGWDFL